MNDYTGKRVVVIGGTHGMGLAIAKLAIAAGGRALVTGRNERNVSAARAELGERGYAIRSDVSSMAEIARLANQVREHFSTIDALFVNVGISELAPFEEVSEESYDRQFAINTKGPFFTVQGLLPLLPEGSAIVFTTVTPTTGTATMGVYFATKGAIAALARVLGAELVARKIRVNAVAPGFIDTPTLGIASASPQERRVLAALGDEITPMKRHGRAEEVARAALFLAFDATFTTGVELPVDGGLSQVDAPQ